MDGINIAQFIQKISIWIVPVIFAITLHEVAHGYVANFLGDRTAKLMGRLSFNPAKHIDMIGTIILPALMLLFSSFIFGWAKPVPVDPRNFKHPLRDMAIVAIAGPFSNLIMAFFWAICAKLGIYLVQIDPWFEPLFFMGRAGILINIVLAALNVLPIPPLDGSRVLMAILPKRIAWQLRGLENYGTIILLLLMITNILPMILLPIVSFFNSFIEQLVGLPPIL